MNNSILMDTNEVMPMPNIRDMIRENKKQENLRESYRDKIFKHKMSTFLWILGIVLIIVITAVVLFFWWSNHAYTYYDTRSSIEREVINGTEDIRLGDAILTYSRDGAHCTNARGNILWNQTFEIQDILIDICQNVAVIAAYNGRDVYVVSDSQILGSFTTNMPIRRVTVSAEGTVAIVMADTDVTHYNLYTAEGKMIYEGQATMSSSGYPMALSLSPNGELLQISYVYLDTGVMRTNVAFYNFGDVGANKTDWRVSSYTYPDLIPYVEFMNDQVSFAVGDGRLIIYKGAQIPVELTQFFYTEEVRSVFYNENYIGLVFYAYGQDALYKMNVYSASGEQVGSYYFNLEYDDIFFEKDGFVAYNSKECVITTMGGVEKYNGTFEKTVRRMMPTSSSHRYLIVTNESIDVIGLR